MKGGAAALFDTTEVNTNGELIDFTEEVGIYGKTIVGTNFVFPFL